MSPRSIFGVTVSPVAAWCLLHPERFAEGLGVLPRAWTVFAARSHGRDVRKGDLLALTVRQEHPRHARLAALEVRAVMDTTLPTHPEPYAALCGRVVAVATLTGSTQRARRLDGSVDPWRREDLRRALGCHDRDGAPRWWWGLGDVIALPAPVECQGDAGLWSLPREVSVAVMDQVRAAEAARAQEARQ